MKVTQLHYPDGTPANFFYFLWDFLSFRGSLLNEGGASEPFRLRPAKLELFVVARHRTQKTMLLTSVGARIEGYSIAAYQGTVRGDTWNELLRRAAEIGANAVLNTCFDDALDVDTLLHGTAVVLRRDYPTRHPRLRPEYGGTRTSPGATDDN